MRPSGSARNNTKWDLPDGARWVLGIDHMAHDDSSHECDKHHHFVVVLIAERNGALLL
jgi:hypothetical protein